MFTETNRRNGLLIFAAIIITAMAVVGFWTYSQVTKREKLDSAGQKTKGLFDEEFIERRSKFGYKPDYKVTYQFNLNGKTYEGSGVISEKPIFRNWGVTIIYDPDDPANNRLENDVSQNLLIAMISLAFLGLLLIIIIAECAKSFRNTS